MRFLVVVAALTLAVGGPATAGPALAGPALAASGCPLFPAGNGSSGFIGGVPDERWDNDALRRLRRVTLADFEAVDSTGLRSSPASAAVRGGAAPAPGPARQLLAAALGLVAAALAMRQLARSRGRRR
jgi:hypothetical protein